MAKGAPTGVTTVLAAEGAYGVGSASASLAPVTLVPTPPPIDPHAVLEQALSEDTLLIPIVHAARTQWRASAWLLERRYPERWGHGEPPRCPTATWSGG